MNESRAAVVGASGFVGSALTKRLQSLGVHTACFTRSVPFINDTGGLDSELAAADTVFWLASSIRPATAGDHSDLVVADRHALETLLDGLARAGHEPCVVAVSSGGTVYDPSAPPPYREDSPVRPANAYGEAMREIERLIHSAPGGVVLRVGNAYGPGQPARRGQGVVAYWLANIAGDEPIHVVGSETVARDYVFIDDIVDALVLTHEAERAPRLLNIGSGRPTALGELLEGVREAVAPREVTVVREPSRGFDAPSTWLDTRRADDELGWIARTSLRDGLAATWRHQPQPAARLR